MCSLFFLDYSFISHLFSNLTFFFLVSLIFPFHQLLLLSLDYPQGSSLLSNVSNLFSNFSLIFSLYITVKLFKGKCVAWTLQIERNILNSSLKFVSWVILNMFISLSQIHHIEKGNNHFTELLKKWNTLF